MNSMEGTMRMDEGEVTVDEVRIGLFRVLWKFSKYDDESVKHCQKFRVEGWDFDSDFQISRKKESFGHIVKLKFISCSDKSLTKPGDEQSKSKRFKLEEESVSPKLRSLPSVEVYVLGDRVPQTPYMPGKWNIDQIQTAEGDHPFIEFWIDFGTNELNNKLVVHQLAKVLYNQTLCDVKFKFKNGEEIGAHVVILSTASPVFAAMFQSDFVESKTRIVNIADIDMEVFKEMLIYLYTGKAPNLVKNNFARSVYEVADKYGVNYLKDDCENILLTQLNNNNALELLVWAQFHSLRYLIEETEKFIAKNAKELCSQPAWLDFMKDHPKLCLKIIQIMAKLIPKFSFD